MVVRASTELGFVEQGLDLLEFLEHGIPVLLELGRARIEAGAQGRCEQRRLHGVPICLERPDRGPPKGIDTQVTDTVIMSNQYFHMHAAGESEWAKSGSRPPTGS